MIAGVLILVVSLGWPLWFIVEHLLVRDPWHIGRSKRAFLKRQGPT